MAESSSSPYFIGTAGWTIPTRARDLFFAPETVKPNHLLAYSSAFSGVEINSSFHRDHQGNTYKRWKESTPPDFRFSIKLAKRFTHQQALKVDTADLSQVIQGIMQLEEKLGVLLVQIPPKLSFDQAVAEDFFAALRELYFGPIAFEPRHVSWVSREAISIFEEYKVARVMADPDVIGTSRPIKNTDISYFRLHGSPQTYYSEYSDEQIQQWSSLVAEALSRQSKRFAWCIFDNTAVGYATLNALKMLDILKSKNAT